MIIRIKKYRIKTVSGISLAELLVATVLIMVVLLTAASLDIAARRFYSKAEKGTVALNNITTAIEYMERDFRRTMGDVTSNGFAAFGSCPGCCGGCCGGYDNGFRLSLDGDSLTLNDDGIFIPPPNDYYYTYCYRGTPDYIIDYTDRTGVIVTIARNVVNFNVQLENPPGVVLVSLTGRDDPVQPADSINNPNVTLQTRAYFRSTSLR